MTNEFTVLNNPGYNSQTYFSKNPLDKEESVFGKDIIKKLDSIPNGINSIQIDGFYRNNTNPQPPKIKTTNETANQTQQSPPNIMFLSLSTQRKADFTAARPTANIFATAGN